MVGLDRKEKGPSGRSAIQDVEAEFGISVISIIDIDHIYKYLDEVGDSPEILQRIDNYRREYGV